MARPIPEDIRRTLGGEALRLLPDDAMREMQARAVALQHLSTRLHDGDGFQREEGDDLYLALTWLSEGLVDQLNALALRRDEPATSRPECDR